MRQKPLLLVDIDGVISLFGAPAPWGAPGQRIAEAVPDEAVPDEAVPAEKCGEQQIEGSMHAIDGMVHFLSRTAAAHLLELASEFDLVWASGWEEKADEHLPHLLGLPAGLPFLRFERSPGRGHAHWKLAAIETYAGDRALAWIDDAFNAACHAWAGARPAPTLLAQTVPERGLTSREAELLTKWARSLAPPPRAGARGSLARQATPRR
jgi:hypothetical protein